MKTLGAIIVFVAVACVGRFYSMNKFAGGEVVPRTPAAIPKTFDYSHLEGAALETAVQRRLLTGTEFIKSNDGIELHMGHFVTNDSSGQPAYACDVFNYVVFQFEAEGFAVAGERPSLAVEGPCVMATTVVEMVPLIIPIEKVLKEKPGNVELNYMNGVAISLKFTNMTEEWPTQWVLSGIKIYNREDGRSVIVDQKSVRALASEPLTMTW